MPILGEGRNSKTTRANNLGDKSVMLGPFFGMEPYSMPCI